MPRIGVVTFPGSLDDRQTLRAISLHNATPVRLWHADATLTSIDAVILPGGFSYGDYLRPGALASRSRIMTEVVEAAHKGIPVLGICNGFQLLTESGLLPGALVPNRIAGGRFTCIEQDLTVENVSTPFTVKFAKGQTVVIPIKNADGCYFASPDDLRRVEDEGRVVLRYSGSNPNGSSQEIAGICNEQGNVVGIMPHPEYAIESGFGAVRRDGRGIFSSLISWLNDAS